MRFGQMLWIIFSKLQDLKDLSVSDADRHIGGKLFYISNKDLEKKINNYLKKVVSQSLK